MKLTTELGALAGAVRFAARADRPGGLPDPGRPENHRQQRRHRDGVRVRLPDLSACPHRCRGERAGHRAGTRAPAGRHLRPAAAPAGQPAQDGPALALACGSTRHRLHLLPVDTYPALPELPAPAGHADAAEFAAAVRQVVIAASRDDTLPALGAIQVAFAADAVTMVATDRYRAALRRLPWQPSGNPLPPPVLIPAAALAEAARAADGDPVSLHVLTGDDGTPAVAGSAAETRPSPPG